MADTEKDYKSSEEKRHYKSLINFFKFLLGAIAVLTGYVAWIIGGSLNDVKKGASDELSNLKNELQETRKIYEETLINLRTDADKEMANLRDNTKIMQDFQKDIISIQIAAIREDARNLALSSAKERIDEAFRGNNIQSEIDSTAKRELNGRLDYYVKNINQSYELMNNLILLSDRVYWGDRLALDELDSLAYYSDNINLQKAAKSLLFQKGIDYKNVIDSLSSHGEMNKNPLAQLGIADSLLLSTADSLKIKLSLEKIILNDTNLYRIATAFIALRNRLGISVNIFDINFIKMSMLNPRWK